MRKQYKREDLGKGIRGKYYAAFQRGSNLVLLRPEVSAAFPTSEDVNDALLALMRVAASSHAALRSSTRRSR